jgi:hypothetical protein
MDFPNGQKAENSHKNSRAAAIATAPIQSAKTGHSALQDVFHPDP